MHIGFVSSLAQCGRFPRRLSANPARSAHFCHGSTGVLLKLPARCSSNTSSDDLVLPPVRKMFELLLQGDRRSLAKCITTLESTSEEKHREAQYFLRSATKFLSDRERETGRYSLRIGLSGPPGAGKSTFIEALGSRLTGNIPWVGKSAGTSEAIPVTAPTPIPTDKHRVAVLTIDPSSHHTGGSLLADKTRMFELSRDPNAFIRPSPSGGNLGGVARTTNESVIMCDAAGHDIILVETVGVGQSEFAVVDMVDLFVLIIPPAGGDELQGIKRGIVEMADIVVVNKADGDLAAAARRVAAEYSNALKYRRQRRPDWKPNVMLVSSHKGNGLPEFWNRVLEFQAKQLTVDALQQNRRKQLKVWMWNYVRDGIWNSFKTHATVQAELPEIEKAVLTGELPPGLAAERLISLFHAIQ